MSDFSEDFKIKMEKLLREDTPKFFLSLEEPIQKAITVNFSRMSKEKFERVVDFNISQVPEVDNGYYVDNNLGIGKHILSHLGVIYSQEPSCGELDTCVSRWPEWHAALVFLCSSWVRSEL